MLTLLSVFIVAACYVTATPVAKGSFETVSAAVQPRSSINSLDEHVLQVVSFWTEAKLKAAKPVTPSLKISSQSITKTYIVNDDPQVSTDGIIGSLQKAAAAANPDPLISKQVFGYTGRQTYTTGKIFWNNTGNNYGMCSGAIVTAGNKGTIVTAGHCCYDYDAKKWRMNQNFIFVPAYKSGAQPHGKWAAREMTAYTAWTVNQNYNYDVCFVNLFPNANGQHIQDLLGAEGVGANYPRDMLMYSFGYPYNLAYGEIMQYCSGKAEYSKYRNNYIGQTIPCDMTGGCSGGPWLQDFTISTGIGYVTSLNSFTINSISNYMNGPYFDSSIYSLYQQCAIK